MRDSSFFTTFFSTLSPLKAEYPYKEAPPSLILTPEPKRSLTSPPPPHPPIHLFAFPALLPFHSPIPPSVLHLNPSPSPPTFSLSTSLTYPTYPPPSTAHFTPTSNPPSPPPRARVPYPFTQIPSTHPPPLPSLRPSSYTPPFSRFSSPFPIRCPPPSHPPPTLSPTVPFSSPILHLFSPPPPHNLPLLYVSSFLSSPPATSPPFPPLSSPFFRTIDRLPLCESFSSCYTSFFQVSSTTPFK